MLTELQKLTASVSDMKSAADEENRLAKNPRKRKLEQDKRAGQAMRAYAMGKFEAMGAGSGSDDDGTQKAIKRAEWFFSTFIFTAARGGGCDDNEALPDVMKETSPKRVRRSRASASDLQSIIAERTRKEAEQKDAQLDYDKRMLQLSEAKFDFDRERYKDEREDREKERALERERMKLEQDNKEKDRVERKEKRELRLRELELMKSNNRK